MVGSDLLRVTNILYTDSEYYRDTFLFKKKTMKDDRLHANIELSEWKKKREIF